MKNRYIFINFFFFILINYNQVLSFNEEELANIKTNYTISIDQYQSLKRDFINKKNQYQNLRNQESLEETLNQAKLAMYKRNEVLINFLENLQFYLKNFTNFQKEQSAISSQIINFQTTFNQNSQEIDQIIDYETFVNYNDAFLNNLIQVKQLTHYIFYSVIVDKTRYAFERLDNIVQKIRQNPKILNQNELQKKDYSKRLGQINENIKNILENLNKLEFDYKNTNDQIKYQSFLIDNKRLFELISQTQEELQMMTF